MMKFVSILFALAALVTGLLAAYKWYNASNVGIDFGYTYPGSRAGETYTRGGIKSSRFLEPTDDVQKQMNEMDATLDAMKEAAKLNKVAARWTAATVAFSALSAILGILA